MKGYSPLAFWCGTQVGGWSLLPLHGLPLWYSNDHSLSPLSCLSMALHPIFRLVFDNKWHDPVKEVMDKKKTDSASI